MRKNIFFIAIICILFTGCKKWGGVSEPKEDLSYVIRTYYRYETNGHIIKQTWTYDGYKETGYKYYYDGKLTQERNNYSYDGLKASYDSYSYRDSIIGHQHIECEFLDETFRRTKYLKSYAYYPNPQNNHFYDIREYKKKKEDVPIFRHILFLKFALMGNGDGFPIALGVIVKKKKASVWDAFSFNYLVEEFYPMYCKMRFTISSSVLPSAEITRS